MALIVYTCAPPRTNIVMPGLSVGLEKSHTIWDLCTEPLNLIPTTHPSDPLATTLRPQLRIRILKSLFFAIPSTYYLSFYDHIVGLVRLIIIYYTCFLLSIRITLKVT